MVYSITLVESHGNPTPQRILGASQADIEQGVYADFGIEQNNSVIMKVPHLLLSLAIALLFAGCKNRLSSNSDTTSQYLGNWQISEITSVVEEKIEDGVPVTDNIYLTIEDDRLIYFNEYFEDKEGSFFYYIDEAFNIDTLNRELWKLDNDTIWFTSSDSIMFYNPDDRKELGKSLLKQKLIRIDTFTLNIDPLLIELKRSFYNHIAGLVEWEKQGDGRIFSTNYFYSDSLKTILELENELKAFFDHQIGELPVDKYEKFSEWERASLHCYIYENLDIELRIEIYEKWADLEDDYSFNDKDRLYVKLWLYRKS